MGILHNAFAASRPASEAQAVQADIAAKAQTCRPVLWVVTLHWVDRTNSDDWRRDKQRAPRFASASHYETAPLSAMPAAADYMADPRQPYKVTVEKSA